MSTHSVAFGLFRTLLVKANRQYLALSHYCRQNKPNAEVTGEYKADLVGDYEVSTKEMKYVDRLLPSLTVPPKPEDILEETPSGWIPPKDSATELPYYVRRTKNHMFPVYNEVKNGNRHLVMIKKIDGDIWAFNKDLKEYLERIHNGKQILSQVHEVGRFIRIKGQYIHDVGDFLVSKGF